MVIERGEGTSVVAVAKDADEAVQLAADHRPDVAVLDVRMPGGGGPAAAEGIRAVSPNTQLLALSAHGDESSVKEMIGRWVRGYLGKGASAEEIRDAIRRAANGDPILSGEVAGQVFRELASRLEGERREDEHRKGWVTRVQTVLLGRGGPRMVFQPIKDLRSGDVVGMEALARFPGEWPPNVWFDEAAAGGLGVELEVDALRKALAHLSDLPEDAFVSINLSADAAVSETLRDVLTAHPSERIVLELTEHARVGDYDRLVRGLDELRESGLRLAVDDVGAGFSSLRHVLNLSPDFVKLDVSLTRDVATDPRREALATALVAFATKLETTIVAEGIERQEELDVLRRLGVTHGQGYFLGRPAPLTADESAPGGVTS